MAIWTEMKLQFNYIILSFARFSIDSYASILRNVSTWSSHTFKKAQQNIYQT
jgi:hypothetical protein